MRRRCATDGTRALIQTQPEGQRRRNAARCSGDIGALSATDLVALNGGVHGSGKGVVAIGDVEVVVAVNGDGRVCSDAVGGVDGRADPRTCFVGSVVQIVGGVPLVGDVDIAHGIVNDGVETTVIGTVLNGGGRPGTAGVVGVLQ